MANNNREIRLRCFDCIGKRSIAFDPELDLHAWIERRKVRQHRRQNSGKVLRTANSNVAGHVRALHRIQELIMQCKNAPRVSKSGHSRFSQRKPASTLTKEGYTKIILKSLHLQANGRWRAAKLVRRPCQTAYV